MLILWRRDPCLASTTQRGAIRPLNWHIAAMSTIFTTYSSQNFFFSFSTPCFTSFSERYPNDNDQDHASCLWLHLLLNYERGALRPQHAQLASRLS